MRKSIERKADNEDSRPELFPYDDRALDGYLKSLDPSRDAKIKDQLNGLYLLPCSACASDVVDTERNYCSHLSCKSHLGTCRHLWEVRFRFRDLVGKRYRLPPKVVIVGAKSNGSYVGVKRSRKRENSDVSVLINGNVVTRKRHTVSRQARMDKQSRGLEILFALIKWLRHEEQRTIAQGLRVEALSDQDLTNSRVGRPPSDIYELLFAETYRVMNGLTYEAMGDASKGEIPRLVREGWIQKPFHFNRLCAALNESKPYVVGFGERIEVMTLRLMRVFRLVSHAFLLDGTVFSTAWTDNPRRNVHSQSGPVRLMCHALYEEHWGFLASFRLTFHARGRGSGEAPQLPYLVERVREVFTPVRLMADGAYGSDRNRAYCDSVGVNLIAPFKTDPLRFNPKTKKYLTPQRAQELMKEQDPDGPLMRHVYPIRNRVEGDHAVIKNCIGAYVVSRPDRKRYFGLTPLNGFDQKSNPNKAERYLPEDQAERDRIISTEQFVGVACLNELRLKQFVSVLKAVIHAEGLYQDRFDPFADRAFEPKPELQELLSPFTRAESDGRLSTF